MLSRLWYKITGGDKGKKYPDQQAVALGRTGDILIVYPYGSYCDLPDGVRLCGIGDGIAIPAATSRPADVERGEPVFYHPETGARLVFRNNGDIDLDAGTAVVNITAATVNVTAASAVNIDAPVSNIGVGGQPIARVGDSIQVTVPAFGTHVGTIISGGSNTSI